MPFWSSMRKVENFFKKSKKLPESLRELIRYSIVSFNSTEEVKWWQILLIYFLWKSYYPQYIYSLYFSMRYVHIWKKTQTSQGI